MVTKIMTIVGAVLITATTAQAAAVVHKHQNRNASTKQTSVVGEKARASMAMAPGGHFVMHHHQGEVIQRGFSVQDNSGNTTYPSGFGGRYGEYPWINPYD